MKIHNPDILNLSGWQIIGKEVAVNSSAIDFVLPSTFKSFAIIIRNVTVSVDDRELWMRFSTDGGSTFLAGASDYAWINGGSSGSASTTFAGTADAADNQMNLTRGTGSRDLSNADAEDNYNGMFFLYNMHQSTVYPTMGGTCHYWNADTTSRITQLTITGSLIANIAAVDAVRILPETGTMSGEFEIYGISEFL